MDGYSGLGRPESGFNQYLTVDGADGIRILKNGKSAIIPYQSFIDQLAIDVSLAAINTLTAQIEGLFTRYVAGTWTAGSPVATSSSWVTMPVNPFGTAITSGITMVNGVISIANPGLYAVQWRMTGDFSTPATILSKLRFNVDLSPTDLIFSDISEQYSNDKFTLSGFYLINPPVPVVIDCQYSTVASETWNNAKGFVTVVGMLPKYGNSL